MRCFDDGPTVLTDSIFTLEVRAGNLNGGKWFLSGLPPMTRKAAESMKRQYADSKMWDGVRVTEWVRKEDAVEQTAANTVKTEEKQENTVKNSGKTMDNTIIALLALSVATLLHGAARHFLSKGDSGKEWFPKELGEAVRKGRKALETDETAKRIYDNAPEDAKRLLDLILANKHTLNGTPDPTLANRLVLNGATDPALTRLFNETHTAVVDAMTDGGWDYILSNEGSEYFKTVVGWWREMSKRRLSNQTKDAVKTLETDETAKRGHDDAPTEANGRFKRLPRGRRTRRRPSAQASEQSHGEEPEDAKRFNTLAQMYKFLVHGRPCRRTMGKFNREYDEVVGSMTDEGWDHVLNNSPFKDIARDWRENGRPEIALALDRAECQDCGKTTKSNPSNQ